MGWLFAVALGMQKQSGRAVWLSLLPIALGHALAIGLVVAVAAVVGMVMPAMYIRISVACILVGFGLYRILRRAHPRWGGMQVGFRDLTIWSFLMASAHGAGLMLLPLVMEPWASRGQHGQLPHHAVVQGSWTFWTGIMAVTVHTLGYLLLTGSLAFVVHQWLGLSLLRKAWVNLDLLWGAALIVAAGAALVM